MKKEIEMGGILPKYYGVAWIEWNRGVTVCYPFPLNHIFGLSRTIWIKVRNHPLNNVDELKYKNSYLEVHVEHLKSQLIECKSKKDPFEYIVEILKNNQF